MSEVLRTAWSIASAGWRAAWNRSFRFSRGKAAMVMAVVQGVFFVFVSRRSPVMSGASAAQSLGGMLILIALQMGLFGFMSSFSRGQMDLYKGVLVSLFQISPARPLSLLIGKALEAVPGRLWSSLLWSWALSSAIGGSVRWGAMALLAVAGIAVGTAAHLSGLLLLVLWGRYSPKTMYRGGLLSGLTMIALVTWAIIFLARGGTLTEVGVTMQQYRWIMYAVVMLLAGMPALGMLGALAVKPQVVEDLYREGVSQVLAIVERGVVRPRRSLWLSVRDGVTRAVLSREWLELARSLAIRAQAVVWAAGTVGVWFAGVAVRGQAPARQVAFIGGLSLLAWFLAYGHLVMQTFAKERRTMLLYRLAGVPSRKLLVAKFAGAFVPSAVLVTISTAVGSLAARLGIGQAFTVAGWTLLGLAAGTMGGLGMAAATAGEGAEEEQAQGQPAEGQPPQPAGNGWWTMARIIALAVTAALPVWTGAGRPGLPVNLAAAPFLVLDAGLPLLLLAGGYWLMSKVWEARG